MSRTHDRRRTTLLAMVLAAGLCFPGGLTAQQAISTGLQGVSIEQKLDAQVPLDLTFLDETGKTVRLGDYFGDKPVVLTLVYYNCPMLCTMVLNGALRSFRVLSFDIGKDFEVVTVSIAPAETPAMAAEKKKVYVHQYERPGGAAGWHFLTGNEESIRQLADAVGFHYTYNPETGLYTHASALMLLTPEGRMARYFYGIEYSARDLRLGLVEASQNKIGSPVDQVLLYCYQYDPTTGKYGLLIMRTLRTAGLVTLLVLGLFLFISFRREKKVRAPSPNGNGKREEA